LTSRRTSIRSLGHALAADHGIDIVLAASAAAASGSAQTMTWCSRNKATSACWM
jgi:hypothetical protein